MVPPTSHKVSRVSWYFGYCLSLFVFPYGAFTLSGRLSQYRSGNSEYNLLQSLTLQCTHRSLGSFPFARRYSGNRCFFLFLRLLRCFSSPGSLYMAMYSPYSDWSSSSRVSPFRNRRVNGYLLLTVAYRSLSRLSSALSAKASTLRSYMLDHNQNCIFIHSSRTDSVLCSLVAGISWFFLVCFYWTTNNYYYLSSPRMSC